MPRKTRFRMAANLVRTGFTPVGFLSKVSVMDHVIAFSFAKLFLAHVPHCPPMPSMPQAEFAF
jgi:hypothetical protein